MKINRGARSLVIGIVLAAVAVAAAPAGPASPYPARPAVDIKAVEAVIAEHIKAGDLVGVSLAYALDGKIVKAAGYGRARIADPAPVTAETQFACGSVTKQFTAACILLLAEDGRLSVHDKVAKYYPNLTRAADITLLDLLNHVSGYPDYYPLDFVIREMAKPIAEDEVIRRYATGKLDFEPGSRYSYSNTGYLILGRIVERVSGQPFAAFLTRRILNPLGMDHTTYAPEAVGPAYAAGHTTFALSPFETAVPEGRGWIAAAGALFSTASDLVRWDLGLTGGKVLKPESFKLMTARRRLNDGTISNYACGIVNSDRDGVTILAHNGAVNGAMAFNLVVPSTGSAVAVLINTDTGGSQFPKIYGPIVPAFFPAPAKPAAATPSAKPAPAKPMALKTDAPVIAGLPAAEEAKRLFLALQAGTLDRKGLGDEYSAYLTEARMKGAAARFKPFGAPVGVTVLSIGERGGMEVSTAELKFAAGPALRTAMYRTPDGKVQQFFVNKD